MRRKRQFACYLIPSSLFPIPYSLFPSDMAKAINIIKKDLVNLEEKVGQLFREIYHLYSQYIELLSRSVRRQLMVACYQICTQIYPESFLNLSFDERYKLQENLKQIGKEIEAQLLFYLASPDNSSTENNLKIEDIFFKQEVEPGLAMQAPATASNLREITNPEALVQWCKSLEKGIQTTLERLSHEANHQLQQAHILPTKLPTKIIEIALQAEESGPAASHAPNLLDLMIETETKQGNSANRSGEKTMRITTIHLRLAEIEFADPSLTVARKQIRDLSDKINRIRQQYRQVEKDYAIAKAESAWRSSWSDDL